MYSLLCPKSTPCHWQAGVDLNDLDAASLLGWSVERDEDCHVWRKAPVGWKMDHFWFEDVPLEPFANQAEFAYDRFFCKHALKEALKLP